MAGKTTAEQLVALKATREALQEKMTEVAQKSIDESRSMNTAESEEFDTSEAEIKRLDDDIARFTRMEAIQGAKAQPPVVPDQPAVPGVSFATVKTVEKLEPGIAFARQAMCLVHAKGDHDKAFRLAAKYYPQSEALVKLFKAQSEGANLPDLMRMKATVPAGTTTDSTWAAPLVYAQTTTADFIDYLRPRTLIGQANFRPIPFNVRIPRQTSGGTSRWVGQGKSKPVTKFDYDAVFTSFTKVAGITVITEELARFSDPSAEALVRDQLADTVIERIDSDLFDPAVAPSST